MIAPSSPTGAGSASLRGSGQCLLRLFTSLCWTSRSSTNHNNLLRLEVVPKRRSPSSIRASSQSMLTPKATICMLNLYSRKPRHLSSHSSSSPIKRSATRMNCSTDTNRALSLPLHSQMAFGQEVAILVLNRSTSNCLLRVVKTSHLHLFTRTCQPNSTTPLLQAAATLRLNPKVANRRLNQILPSIRATPSTRTSLCRKKHPEVNIDSTLIRSRRQQCEMTLHLVSFRPLPTIY